MFVIICASFTLETFMPILMLLSLLLMPTYLFAEEEAPPVIQYVDMKPDFIVNLAAPKTYMRAKLQLMIKGDELLPEITKNMPAIRHSLLLYFGDLYAQDLQTSEQRETLRTGALQVIKATLKKCFIDDKALGDVFFTEILVQ